MMVYEREVRELLDRLLAKTPSSAALKEVSVVEAHDAEASELLSEVNI